MHDFVNTLFIL